MIERQNINIRDIKHDVFVKELRWIRKKLSLKKRMIDKNYLKI